MRTIWIGVAGFAGAVSRYRLEGWVARRTGGAFPWGTLAVNLSGCFLVGLLVTLLTERLLPHPDLRAAITIGFVGAARRGAGRAEPVRRTDRVETEHEEEQWR